MTQEKLLPVRELCLQSERDHFVGDLFLCSAMSQVQGFYFLLCRL